MATYTTPDNIVYTIDSDGISQISLGARVIATGGIYFRNAAQYFGLSAVGESNNYSKMSYTQRSTEEMYLTNGSSVKNTIGTKTITGSNPYTVTHTHNTGVVVTYTYTFSGRDVIISAEIFNNTVNKISVPHIGGLFFTFNRYPTGVFRQDIGDTGVFGPVVTSQDSQDITPVLYSDPNVNSITGAFLYDNQIGIGVTPWNMGMIQHLLTFDNFKRFDLDSNIKKVLEYGANLPISAGGHGILTINLRLSTNLDWQHLLENYKIDYLANIGTLQYNGSDRRYIASSNLNAGRASINDGNPYGLKTDGRADLTNGSYLAAISPIYATTKSRGNITWDYGGRYGREGGYRAEYDVWPTTTDSTVVNEIIPFYQSKNMDHGVCINYKHFNYTNSYEAMLRYRMTASNQTSDPLQFYSFKDTLVSLGDTTREYFISETEELWATGAPQLGTLRYYVSGTWTGTIELQYWNGSSWVAVVSNITANTGAGTTFAINSLATNRRWRFAVTSGSWSGTAHCFIYRSQANNLMDYFVYSSDTTPWTSGTVNIEREEIDNSWTVVKAIHCTTATGAGGSSSTIPVVNASNFQIGDLIYIGLDTALTITNIVSNNITVDRSIAWANNDIVSNGTPSASTPFTFTQIPARYRIRSSGTWGGVARSILDNKVRYDVLGGEDCRTSVSLTFLDHLKLNESRMQNCINKGMTLFYGDTVGKQYECAILSKHLRNKFGANFQILNEWWNEYLPPFVGFYSSIDLSREPLGTVIKRRFQTKTTLTNGSGTGTTFTVTTGEGTKFSIGDTLIVGNDSNLVVTSVSSNTVTVNTSFTWANGETVTGDDRTDNPLHLLLPPVVFRTPLFTVMTEGTFTTGSILVQRYNTATTTWVTEYTYNTSGTNSYEVSSMNSYINNERWRIKTTSDFVGDVTVAMMDNIANVAHRTATATSTQEFNVTPGEESVTINGNGQQSLLPTPFFRGNFVFRISGTWTGTIVLERNDGSGWVTVNTYVNSASFDPNTPVEINGQNSHWRVRSTAWTSGSASIIMGQPTVRTAMWFVKIMKWILGENIDVAVAPGGSTSTTNNSNYKYAYQNKLIPIVGGYTTELNKIEALQPTYVNDSGAYIS